MAKETIGSHPLVAAFRERGGEQTWNALAKDKVVQAAAEAGNDSQSKVITLDEAVDPADLRALNILAKAKFRTLLSPHGMANEVTIKVVNPQALVVEGDVDPDQTAGDQLLVSTASASDAHQGTTPEVDAAAPKESDETGFILDDQEPVVPAWKQAALARSKSGAPRESAASEPEPQKPTGPVPTKPLTVPAAKPKQKEGFWGKLGRLARSRNK